jgi:hypothetical protein
MKFFKGQLPWNKGLTGQYTKRPYDYMKAWLSGFLAGEGCFFAYITVKDTLGAGLQINLRKDDTNILHLVNKLFDNTGIVKFVNVEVTQRNNPNRNPVVNFRIANIKHLYEKVIPLIEEYPLLSKKQKDFEIWKQIVKLLYKTSHKQNSRKLVKSKILDLIQQLHDIKKYRELS